MPFQIIRNDITKVQADALVNTANPKPIIGSGTDSAIYAAAGEKELLAARQGIGDIARGDVVATPAFALHAQFIFHTVGPTWVDGEHGEFETLRSCYQKSLELAEELHLESIAFPLIATGVYGFPKDRALQIATAEIQSFLFDHEMEVTLVVFDRKAFELSGKVYADINAYIDENYVAGSYEEEYARFGYARESMASEPGRRRNLFEMFHSKAQMATPDALEAAELFEEEEVEYDMAAPEMGAAPDETSATSEIEAMFKGTKRFDNLDDLMAHAEDTFQQRLFYWIDQSGMTDVQVYKRANISKKVFSTIRSNVDYQPKKKTAVALAIALELNLHDTLDLLSRAEYTFSPSSKFDLLIGYCITHHIYNIFDINNELFQRDLPTLGADPN